MKIKITSILLVSFIMSLIPMKSQAQIDIEYPETRKDKSIVDDYHGTVIADPYRWLENDHSDETMEWVKDQNKVTFAYLESLPFRKEIQERLTDLLDYEKVSAPFKEGDYYYFYKNDGLQNQSILYRSSTQDGDGEVVLDPNLLSEDGTSSLGGLSFNEDGSLLGYAVSEGGSDWQTIYVLDPDTRELHPDKIEWVKFSGISWGGDGFYYSRYPSPEENQALSGENAYHKVYYHELGTDQSDDKLIMQDTEHANRNFYAGTSDDESILYISAGESTSGNAFYVKELRDEDGDFIHLVDEFDNDFSAVDNIGNKLIVLTNKNAPNQKLIQIDLDLPEEDQWIDLIPESEDKLASVSLVGEKLFVNYIHNASTLIKVYDTDGNYIQDLDLPGIGSASGISGKSSDQEGFFTFTSFTYPTTIFKLDTETLTYELYRSSEVNFNPENYTTEQIWYTSKDGTKVPMFATYKKGLKMDGTNPTLLYGYGGFNVSLTPSFSVTRLPLLENGGIYVVANLRGGGEFGSNWHKSGTLERKQNVFNDFQAAAEYLIDNKFTSSEKLAIEGGSNGGLLVGACMTQNPELYAVAFPRVGVLDMLRYHMFTIGWAWATDYGRSDDEEAFEYLIKYSPLHNVTEQDYPATLVTTADHDDRVVPAHSFKFIAELQDKHTGEDPVLIRIETSAGHGAGKPISKVIEESSDMLAFMLYNMNVPYQVQK